MSDKDDEIQHLIATALVPLHELRDNHVEVADQYFLLTEAEEAIKKVRISFEQQIRS